MLVLLFASATFDGLMYNMKNVAECAKCIVFALKMFQEKIKNICVTQNFVAGAI